MLAPLLALALSSQTQTPQLDPIALLSGLGGFHRPITWTFRGATWPISTRSSTSIPPGVFPK